MGELDKSYQCGYCLLDLEDMIESRYLPCGHLFCLPCLENDYRNSPNIVCITCRKEHFNVELKSLLPYLKKCVKNPKCDLCGETAVTKFCVKCDKTLCSTHAQEHQAMLEVLQKFDKDHLAHKLVDMNQLDEIDCTIQRREESICLRHADQEIKVACAHCYAALCNKCLSANKCSNGYFHKLIEINELTDQLQSYLNALLKQLFDKSSKAIELENTILCLLEEKTNECEQMKSHVDKSTNEQIEAIQQKSLELKSKIDDYQKVCVETIEKYLADVVNTKDTLDSQRKWLHSLKHHKTSIKVLLSEFSKAKEKTEKELAKAFANFSLPNQKLVLKEKNRELELSISSELCVLLRHLTFSEPVSLAHKLSGASEYGSTWESVAWLDKYIACTRSKYPVELRNKDLAVIGSFPAEYSHICSLGNYFIFLKYDGRGFLIDLFSGKLEKIKTLVSFSDKNEGASSYVPGMVKLSSSFDKFAVVDNNMKVIRVYTAEGQNLLDLSFASYVSNISEMCIVKNESLVIMGEQNPCRVFKFLFDDISVPAWKCELPIQGTGMVVDDAGYIYVSSYSDGIRVISDRGMELKRLMCAEFKSINKISISADNLVAASGTQVKVFKICF